MAAENMTDAWRSIRHEITVTALQALLTQLEPADLLAPNAVGNLLIVREGLSIGFIDLLHGQSAIQLWSDEGKKE